MLYILVIRTTKRPVPLEHCLFYAGELYRVCENEAFLPQGLKAVKDAYKKKNASTVKGGPVMHSGSAVGSGGAHAHNREISHRGKQKHSGSHGSGNVNGTAVGNFTNGSQNNLGLRRSDASLWLQLVNKLSKKSLLPVREISSALTQSYSVFDFLHKNVLLCILHKHVLCLEG